MSLGDTDVPKTEIRSVSKVDDVQLRPFSGGRGTIQRIHDADARVYLASAVIALFLIIFGVEVYGCIGLHYCHDIHDFKDTIEPFAGACFTALGAAIAFYFADRGKSKKL